MSPSSFTIHSLGLRQVPIVFPLVNAAYPDIDLERWQDFAHALIDAPQRSGALCLQGEGGYFCGILIYRIGHELRKGPYLAVDLFLAFDLIDGPAAVEALMSAAEGKARELDCASIELRIDNGHKFLAQYVRKSGYSTAAELVSKEIAKRSSAH